jgi:acyl carrier protein phosphodiesterase
MSRISASPRAQKEEGSISSLFASLSGEASSVFPARFLDLKRVLWRDEMVQSWREVLADLEAAVEEISCRKSEVHLRPSLAKIWN